MSIGRASLRQGWPIALVSAFVGFVVLVAPFTWGLTHLSYELPYLLRPDQPVDDAVIVYMDIPSEERLRTGRWERWDRTLHVRLLKVLKAAGARAVAFDLVFLDGTNQAANAALVDATREFGLVILAGRPVPLIHSEGVPIGTRWYQPFPDLAKAATWGMAEGADDTGTIREHVRDPDLHIPSLAWRAAELTMSPTPSGGPFETRWVNYYGSAGYLPHASFADVLDPGFPAGTIFSNKVVFVGSSWDIGFTGGTGADYHRTPHTLVTGRKMPGVEVCATTYLNLRRHDWLRRLSPLVESGMIVLIGLVVGFVLAPMAPGRASLLALALAILCPIIAVAVVWQSLWWFPWLIVSSVQIPIALAGTLLRQTMQLHRDKRALEQAWSVVGAGAEPPGGRTVAPAEQPAPARREVWSPVAIGSSAWPSGSPGATPNAVSPSPAAAAPGSVALPPPAVPEHQLLRRIGRGAYGEVWIGRDVIGSYHAIKLVFRDAFKESEPFEREFKGLSRFTPISRNHPGLVHILQVGRNEAERYLYYVMELADDITHGIKVDPATYTPRTLASDLCDHRRLPILDCLDLALRLTEALEFLHQHHLVHRDIKPSNVIFVNGAPKFADIGLVTDMAATDHDVSYLGTKGYIAPEGPGTPAADVYSLGKVIYQMGFGQEVGRFPELPTSVVVDPGESALFGLNRIVLRACENSAAARYPSAAELGHDLLGLRRQIRPAARGAAP